MVSGAAAVVSLVDDKENTSSTESVWHLRELVLFMFDLELLVSIGTTMSRRLLFESRGELDNSIYKK